MRGAACIGPPGSRARPRTPSAAYRAQVAIGAERQGLAADVLHLARAPDWVALTAPGDLVAQFCIHLEAKAIPPVNDGCGDLWCRQATILQFSYRHCGQFCWVRAAFVHQRLW